MGIDTKISFSAACVPRYAKNSNLIGGHFEIQDGSLYEVNQVLILLLMDFFTLNTWV
jgi:hypothetical protein